MGRIYVFNKMAYYQNYFNETRLNFSNKQIGKILPSALLLLLCFFALQFASFILKTGWILKGKEKSLRNS